MPCSRNWTTLSIRQASSCAGQIIDASLIAAPRQRNSYGEKAAIKAGKSAREIWPDKPAKVAQKDTNARWTVKYSKAKTRADGSMPVDLAIPTFGYKSHISIDSQKGIIRRQIITDAAQHDGARLRPDRQHRASGLGRYRLSLRRE